MVISLIVAAAEDNAIGKGNDLLWRLPNDMKFFKNTTWAMPVAMGRRTFETFKGAALPGRLNIVITRQRDFAFPEGVVRVGTLAEAIEAARASHCKELFIAGGGEIYRQSMAHADRVYLTRVHARFPDADTHFEGFEEKDWTLADRQDFPADEKHAYAYSFETWERT
jgi:dihydrofolate reductase